MAGTRLALVATAAFLLVPAAGARADTYCVSDPACVGAGGHDEGANLATAFADAQGHPGPDSVQIGPGTFTAPTPTAFAYNDPAAPVTVVGAGQGITTLIGAAGNDVTVLSVLGSTESTISNLTVSIPDSTFDLGIGTTAALNHVTVTGPSTVKSATGAVLFGGGSATATTIDLPRDEVASTIGIEACGPVANPTMCPGGTGEFIVDSTIAARVAVIEEGVSSMAIHRITAHGLLGVVADSANMTIDDSLILVDPGPLSVGLRSVTDPPTIDAANLTIIGPGTTGPVGVSAEHGDIRLRNSVVTGFQTAIRRDKDFTVETDYSDYTGPIAVTGGTGGTGASVENNHLNVAAGFANAAAGDHRLAAGSPLIDAGDPAGPSAGDSLTDLVGNPRVAGGRLDIGAYEFQPAPPPVAKDTTAPVFSKVSETNKVFAVGKSATPVSAKAKRVKTGTTFRYTLSEDSTVKFAIAQKLPGRRVGKACRKPSRKNRRRRHCTRFVKKGTLTRAGKSGSNSVRFSGRIGRRALKPGRYRVTVTATDAAGNKSKTKTLSFRVVKKRHR